MRAAAAYAISVGVMMFVQWGLFLVTGQVPELQTEPWRIALHLAAEAATGAGLMIAGIGVLRRARWGTPVYLFFAGMLGYSVIVSPGYFAQQGQWAFVGMFAVLLVLTVLSALTVAKTPPVRTISS